jgi:hypothetical protein
MKYKKKPVVIEAIQVPYIFSNNREDYPKWFIEANKNETIKVYRGMITQEVRYVEIKTLEGTMTCNVGDYIIKGVAGEFYPCKKDIFEASYEKVEEENDK